MKELLIYQAGEKIFPANFDLEFYFNILFQYPEGEWFRPDNSQDESFTICSELARMHLISTKEVPRWNNGAFRGLTITFLYQKNLNYNL